MEFEVLFPDRIEIGKNISEQTIKKIAENLEVKIVQFTQNLDEDLWTLLDKILFKKREDITLRLYGGFSDLHFLQKIQHIKHIAVNVLERPKGLEYLAALQGLKSLEFDIYELEDFDLLYDISDKLEILFIGKTQSKKPDLKPLEHFHHLKLLQIENQHKNIEVVSSLVNLKDLTLQYITTPDLEYLKSLKQLESLNITFGGIHNFEAIQGMNNIKHLELYQIRLLEDISFISTLTGLQSLYLSSLPRVVELPSFKNLKFLKKIQLENMKGLQNIDSLEFAPALQEFIHSSVKSMQPEDYIPLFKNKSVKTIVCGFGSAKKNDEFDKLALKFNKIIN